MSCIRTSSLFAVATMLCGLSGCLVDPIDSAEEPTAESSSPLRAVGLATGDAVELSAIPWRTVASKHANVVEPPGGRPEPTPWREPSLLRGRPEPTPWVPLSAPEEDVIMFAP